MNALTLLVDAANAESGSESTSTVAVATVDRAKNNTSNNMSTKINPEEKTSVDGITTVLPSGSSTTERTAAFAAALAARDNSILQQIHQQRQGTIAKNRYLEELRQREQEQISNGRLAANAIMLQREKELQQQAAIQQATLLRLMSSGGSTGAPPTPAGSMSPQGRSIAPSPGMNTRQEAEYLRQLHLEALVQQHRQETLAKLASAQDFGYANGSTAGLPQHSTNGSDNLLVSQAAHAAAVPKTIVSKDIASHKYKRQDTALQKAILMARADEELRKRQVQEQKELEHQHQRRELEQQREDEHNRKQQAAMLHLMANGENNSALMKALRAAATPAGYGNGEESTILQLLEERERQRLLTKHQQNHQSQSRTYLPHTVTSSSAQPTPPSVQLELQKHLQQLQAHRQQNGGSEGDRSDLIGSVFAKVAAAAASANNFHEPTPPPSNQNPSQPLPSQVMSAIAAAEKQEKQKILQLQHQHQNSQESFQSSGMMMDPLSHSQQQRQRLQHQALVQQQQQQQQQAALVQQQQETIQLQQQHQQSVEQDASFHDSKSTILPCRARGMPMDHNVKTAYFVIPPNIKHGTELLCSYFACRNVGIKFRYCVYCKLPVAKRNFAKRHRHSGKIPESELSNDIALENTTDSNADDELASSSASDSPREIHPSENAQEEQPKPQEKNTSGDLLVEPPTDKESSPASHVTFSHAPKTIRIAKDMPPNPNLLLCGEDCSTLSCCVVNCEKSNTNPPEPTQDLKTMESENVDFNNAGPSPVRLTPEPRIETSKRLKAWSELLRRRPKTDQHNSDAMLAWVRDVLRVSDFEEDVESDEICGIDDSDSKIQTEVSQPLNGGTKRKVEETRPLSAKKSKTKALLMRKEQEEIDQSKWSDENSSGDNSTEMNKYDHDTQETPMEDLADDAMRKRDEDFPDDASTSSEESVDLRVRKKSRN